MKPLLHIWIVAAALAFAQPNADVDLKAAMHKEQVQGDLKGAIDAYRKIVAKHAKNRSVVAQAMLRMAECHEKLGQSEAKKVYEDLARNFGDQSTVAAQARARLAALGGGGAASKLPGVATRQIPVKQDLTMACTGWNVSQDGKLMGAVEYATGNMAVIDTATGQCRVLTNWGKWDNKNGFVDEGAISRDGKWLASWHYGAANDGEIRVVGTDGKGERTVYVKRMPEWAIPNDWSPDGKSILTLFERGSGGSTQSGTAEIAAVAADGSGIRVLKTWQYTVRHRPKVLYSPDAKYIAFDLPVQPGNADTDLRIMPASGGPEVRVASSPATDTLVGWTAAGHLVFVSNRSGPRALYLVRIQDGKQAGEPEELRTNLSALGVIGMSAAGTFFYRERVVRSDVMTADIDIAAGRLGDPRPLAPRHPKSTSIAAWSRDGKWLAYRRSTDDVNRTTFVIHPLSGNAEPRELTVPFRRVERGRLVWTPDGKSLITPGLAQDGPGVFRIDVATGQTEKLAGDRNYWDWDSSGRLLVYRGGAGVGHVLDRSNGQKRMLFEKWKSIRAMAFSSDGKQLSFVGNFYEQEKPSPLLVVDVDSGAERQIDSAWFSHEPTYFAWSPDGGHILAIRAEVRTDPKLALIPTRGGEVRTLNLTRPKADVFGLAFHPDGRSITWTQSAADELYWSMDHYLPAK